MGPPPRPNRNSSLPSIDKLLTTPTVMGSLSQSNRTPSLPSIKEILSGSRPPSPPHLSYPSMKEPPATHTVSRTPSPPDLMDEDLYNSLIAEGFEVERDMRHYGELIPTKPYVSSKEIVDSILSVQDRRRDTEMLSKLPKLKLRFEPDPRESDPDLDPDESY
ncbi:predicted protein [Pyrenophora tritici-repentis Pt-1C-BFP]|uniref:Uncharacterized protein n=3 Tax=Pyrenophora tritici-repentis TaxID=45151 RepID=A0A922N5C6_9PLEO|nr:uncharacterized protein PTRG_10310 [Pyrenophora tritici-repentis Pt-1C-BFP]EDU43361.1 predicted protein [Pyrenophora tritici-repentis Pt-1C-BFP]KAI1509450.1 hypothetical protein Ptr86124_011530 [Pyrenophora tritici-repentis]